MNNLIERIKQHQEKQHLTDGQLARILSVDRSTWAKIRSGERNPGIKFLRAVVKEFPKLKPLVDVELFDTTTTTHHQTAHNGILGVLRGWLRVRYLGLKKILRRNKANSDMKSKKPRNSVIKI